MSAGVVPPCVPPGAGLAGLSAEIPACPTPNTALAAEREQQLLALEQAIVAAQQLEQPALAAALEQSVAVQRGAAPPPAAGDGAARGWFSMWRHDMELDRLFYPLAAGMWIPYILRLWPVATSSGKQLSPMGRRGTRRAPGARPNESRTWSGLPSSTPAPCPAAEHVQHVGQAAAILLLALLAW